ncbi:MAG: thiolase family protein [Chloroflexi bacterium]|nr:thiolase family protein [Chloroflexota bacterium]
MVSPTSVYRTREGLGVWEHRGKVAVVGVGHTPVDRRWDGTTQHSMGAYSIIAANRALEDAGLRPDDIDGVVSAPWGQVEDWAPRPLPDDWAKTYQSTGNPEDGITRVSADWVVKNMGLKNVKFADSSPSMISYALDFAAQAVGDGKTEVCLVRYMMCNLPGRYAQGYSAMSGDTAPGPGQWTNPWGWALIPNQGYTFNQYTHKYGKNHDMLAPFVVNLRRNGRMFPHSYYVHHPEAPLTVEDYLSSRWVCKPLCLHDCDRPTIGGASYIVTTAERARDMKQKPVYVLNHCVDSYRARSGGILTLDETEMITDSLARKIYSGSGLTPSELDVYNPYDGFTTFTHYFLEGAQWHGVKRGEGLDFYQGDISVEGPHPFLSSGGNNGTGRTRCAIFTDCIEQLRGTAGERQVRVRAETATAGCVMPGGSAWVVFGSSPD